MKKGKEALIVSDILPKGDFLFVLLLNLDLKCFINFYCTMCIILLLWWGSLKGKVLVLLIC